MLGKQQMKEWSTENGIYEGFPKLASELAQPDTTQRSILP